MKNCSKTFFLRKSIEEYLILMLIGIILRTYITHTITIVWLINLVGLVTLFGSYFRYFDTSIAVYSLAYLLFGLATLVINLGYLSVSLKTVGTNANILVFPVMLNLAISRRTKIEFDNEMLLKILNFLSFLGMVSLVFAWTTGAQGILSIFKGGSVYSVDIAGFFYNKNIYGAFLSLSLAADLYLLTVDTSLKKPVIVGIKLLGVVLSFSRAALLQTVIMLYIFIWIKKKRMVKDYLVLTILIIVAITAIIYIKSNIKLYDFIYNSVLRVSTGDAGRKMLRNRAIVRFGDSFIASILGVGFAGIDTLDIDIDNTYFYLYFSGGIVKLIFYSVALISALIHIIRIKAKDLGLYRLCFAVYISYLFFAFFESIAVLELGLVNFLFTFFIFMIPFSYSGDGKLAVSERKLLY